MWGESIMLLTIPTYRVVCFGRPAGPWRLRLTAARRDAIADGLGCYDEWGGYFDIVPGAIEEKRVSPKLLGLSDEQLAEMITSERRAKLSVRQRQSSRHQAKSPYARDLTSRARDARGRT